MFDQKKEPLKIGDLVVVGAVKIQNGESKFLPFDNRGEKIRVERIWESAPGTTRIELDGGSLGKSRVYLHDEGKLWHRVSNFN